MVMVPQNLNRGAGLESEGQEVVVTFGRGYRASSDTVDRNGLSRESVSGEEAELLLSADSDYLPSTWPDLSSGKRDYW